MTIPSEVTDRPARRPVTRSDVARHAGVSDAVVSYVVNGGPKPVASATRARVLAAVEALGYRPNAAARALSRGATDMIGMVVPDNRNPYFAELVRAVDFAAQTMGRTLLVIDSDSRRALGADHISTLASRQLDGLILAEALTATERAVVDSLDIPVVLINQFREADRLTAIGADYQGGARTAVSHLIEHGHRRVAFIGGDPEIDPRERGWAEALSAADLPLGPIYRVDFSLAGGYRAATRLTADPRPPTAVFIASDQLAIGALAAFHEKGINIPTDLAIVSFDGSTESAYAWPALTTVAQPMKEMAERAVHLLTDRTLEPSFAAFPTSLVIRRSCGCEGLGASDEHLFGSDISL